MASVIDSTNKPSIVLIHGLWMTPLSWEGWIARFEAAGHEVIAPGWPGIEPGEAGVANIRADPSPLAVLDARKIVHHYAGIIKGLATPPIIMGPSFGRGFVQALLNRGLGLAGVAIDAAPSKGILNVPFSSLRSGSGILKNPLNLRKAVPFTRKQFGYAFGNTITESEGDAAYARYAIPAAGHLFFEGALANVWPNSAFAVDYRKSDRAPLLFIAGSKDHVVPPAVNRINVRKYAGNGPILAYH